MNTQEHDQTDTIVNTDTLVFMRAYATKVAQVKADTQAKADAEAALLAKEKALIQSINQKRLKASVNPQPVRTY